MASANDSGVEALRRLKELEPPSLLVPNPTVSETARAASKYLFSSLRPFSPKSPLDQLLVDGYDAEQIWHQIDLQSQPLLSTLHRRLNQLVKNAEAIAPLKVPSDVANKAEPKEQDQWEEESDGIDEELDEADKDEDDFEGLEDEDDEEEKGEGGGIEDKFLKIDELNDYLQKQEDNYEKGEEGDQDSEDDDYLDKVDLIALCLVVIRHSFLIIMHIDIVPCLLFPYFSLMAS